MPYRLDVFLFFGTPLRSQLVKPSACVGIFDTNRQVKETEHAKIQGTCRGGLITVLYSSLPTLVIRLCEISSQTGKCPKMQ